MGGRLHLRADLGTAYTAFTIDAFARLIADWRTATHHSTGLVQDTLVMAVTYRARQGVKVAGLITIATPAASTCRSGTAPSWRPRGSGRRSGRPGMPTTIRSWSDGLAAADVSCWTGS